MEFSTMANLPQIYQIELTERCNLKCPMCLNHTMANREDASKELIDLIVGNDYLRNTVYTEFQMSGEPTLSPTFEYAVKRIKETGTLVGLSTNLTTVRKCILILRELDCITVSFDIFDKELFEKSRFPYKFKDFLGNFEYLMSCILDSTLIQVQTLKTAWTAERFDVAKKEMEQYFDYRYKGRDNLVFRETTDSFINYHGKGKDIKDPGQDMCLNPFLTVSIKADGTVVPCSLDFMKEIPLGNLFEDSLENIWGRMKEFRESHKTGKGLCAKCKTCYNRSPILYMNNEIIQRLLEFKLKEKI